MTERRDRRPAQLDERCQCPPWAQRWMADTPERCTNCGGVFLARTVDARRRQPGDPKA